MPIVDISGIQMKVMGFNFIEDSEERSRVSEHWDNTFFPQHASLMDIPHKTNLYSYDKLICEKIGDAGVNGLEGARVLLTAFVDFRQVQDGAFVDTLAGLPVYLEKTFHCSISLFLQFGFVGRVGFEPTANMRDLAKVIVKKNIAATNTRHLVLVDSSVRSTDHWKKCIALLDVIRRSGYSNVLPAPSGFNLNQCIGYIQYKEDNDAKRKQLLSEQANIRAFIESSGCATLDPCLVRKIQELRDVLERYQYNAQLQPVHPGILGARKERVCLFWKRVSHDFLASKSLQASAIAETVKGMDKLFKSIIDSTTKLPVEELDLLLNEAQIGYRMRFRGKTEIQNLIDNKRREFQSGINSDQLGALTNPEHQNETVKINPTYFTQQRNRAISVALADYLRSLSESVSKIDNEEMIRLQNDQEDRATQLDNDLKMTISSNSILKKLIAQENLFGESSFNFTSGVGTSRIILQITGNEMVALVQSQKATNINAFKIDEDTGRLKNIADSHMKALRVVTVGCSDDFATIDEMLEEVSL